MRPPSYMRSVVMRRIPVLTRKATTSRAKNRYSCSLIAKLYSHITHNQYTIYHLSCFCNPHNKSTRPAYQITVYLIKYLPIMKHCTMNWEKCSEDRVVILEHTYLLTAWSRVLLEKLTGSAASQEIPPHFMEPEGSSPYSQVPATCPYPQPTPSSPHNSLPLPEDPY